MKIFKLLLLFSLSTTMGFSQYTKPIWNVEIVPKEKKPLDYFGRLELSGIIPIKQMAIPAKFAGEAKYWINKRQTLTRAFGFGLEMGGRSRYSVSPNNLIEQVDENQKNHFSYAYSYLSGRLKLQTQKFKVNPYAEIGSGWLNTKNKTYVERKNPDYDPNHICPEGSSQMLTYQNKIKPQNLWASDVEAGFNYALNEKISLNVGVSYLWTKNADYLVKENRISIIENPILNDFYRWENNPAHSLNLKVGISFLIFNDPNIIRIRVPNSTDKKDDGFGDGGGGGGGGGGCGGN